MKACNYTCKTCTGGTKTNCSTCSAGTGRTFDGTNSCPCDNGTYDNGSSVCAGNDFTLIIACHYTCKTCSSGNTNTKCDSCETANMRLSVANGICAC